MHCGRMEPGTLGQGTNLTLFTLPWCLQGVLYQYFQFISWTCMLQQHRLHLESTAGRIACRRGCETPKPRFLVCGRHWRQPTCTSDWREYEQHHVALALPSKFDLSTFVKHSPTIYNTQLPSVTATFSLLKTTPWARRPTHEGLLNGLPTIAAIRCRNPRFQHSPAGRVSWTY